MRGFFNKDPVGLKELYRQWAVQFFVFLPFFIMMGIVLNAYGFLSGKKSLILACIFAIFWKIERYFERKYASSPSKIAGKGIIIWLSGLCVCGGAIALSIKLSLVSGEFLEKSKRNVTITGHVDKIDMTGRKPVLILKDIVLTDKNQAQTLPYAVRFNLTPEQVIQFQPSDCIQAQADIWPFPYPVFPHSYDYRQIALYKNEGASGRLKSWQSTSCSESLAIASRIEKALFTIRQNIKQSLKDHMNPLYAGLASALITGDRSDIPETTNTLWRDAGIYHVISISGLHITMIMTSLFFSVRMGGMVLFLALRKPVSGSALKSLSAWVSLTGSLFYVLLSGGSTPALRAWIMGVCILTGILLYQRFHGLASVMTSLTLIMLLWPESLFDISFQLSFSAMIGMVLGFEVYKAVPLEKIRFPFLKQMLILFVTSLLITVTTTPLIIFTFQQFAIYGVISNLFIIPFTSLCVMPWPVVAVVLSVFGGEGVAWYFMEKALWITDKTAEYVASWPYAVFDMARPSLGVITLVMIGIIAFTLIKSRPRFIAVVILGASLGIWLNQTQTPLDDKLWIAPNRTSVAVRTDSKTWVMLGKPSPFVKMQWQNKLKLYSKHAVFSDEKSVLNADGDRVMLIDSFKDLKSSCVDIQAHFVTDRKIWLVSPLRPETLQKYCPVVKQAPEKIIIFQGITRQSAIIVEQDDTVIIPSSSFPVGWDK